MTELGTATAAPFRCPLQADVRGLSARGNLRVATLVTQSWKALGQPTDGVSPPKQPQVAVRI